MLYDLRTKPTVEAGICLLETPGNTWFVEYQPGNGTRYLLLITSTSDFSLDVRDALGMGQGKGYFVSFPSNRQLKTLAYSAGSYLAPHWLCERVGCTMADAVVLAELLAYLTDCQAQTCEEFQKEHE